MANFYIGLARRTIKGFIKDGKIPPLPEKFPKEILRKKAGVFVSIHKKDGSLRGCIGTFLPTKPNIALEIATNAVSAATQDPRFPLVKEKELADLVYSVDILSQPKPAAKKDLDYKKYGLVVSSSDGRQGLLLPDIAGINSNEEQIKICKTKAGINPKEKVKLEIFTVQRHREK
jgi:AmmeMemoRadiSam system protein A